MSERSSASANSTRALAAACALALAEFRAASGETQRGLARRLGMTESMISRLESGEHVPSLATLCRIADAFDRQLDLVFHEHAHEHPDGVRHRHPHRHPDPEHGHEHDGPTWT